jgi:hypothetical protein
LAWHLMLYTRVLKLEMGYHEKRVLPRLKRVEDISDGVKPINIRALYEKIDFLFWKVAGYARQIHDWNINFKYL